MMVFVIQACSDELVFTQLIMTCLYARTKVWEVNEGGAYLSHLTNCHILLGDLCQTLGGCHCLREGGTTVDESCAYNQSQTQRLK
eukprot:339771-Amphidinium_carterae.1